MLVISTVKPLNLVPKVWSHQLKICLYVGIALASYMYILDNGTNWQWGSLASTKFLAFSEWLSIGTVTSTLREFAVIFAPCNRLCGFCRSCRWQAALC